MRNRPNWNDYGQTSFEKLCYKTDMKVWRKAEVIPPKPRRKFPKATIDATLWLMTFHPDRLQQWLDRHEPGLEQAATTAALAQPAAPDPAG